MMMGRLEHDQGGRPGFDSVGSIFCRKTFGFEFRQKEKNLRVRGRREEDFGHFDMEGWLCPALFLYFEEASQKLYVQVKSR
jgi:hypothetical protein